MTTSELFRRDPPKGKKEFSANKGFTVIELMITIGVLAIIASLALPSYRAIIEKRQVTKGAEQLAAFLSQAKSQAVKLNDDVAISYVYDDGDWCMGYSNSGALCDCADDTAANYCEISYDYDRDGVLDATEPHAYGSDNFTHPEVLSGITLTAADGAALGDDAVLLYDSVRGMLQVDDAGDQAAAAIFALVSTGGQYALNVEIDRLGRVTLCSPSSDDHSPVPGYPACAL